CALFVNPFCLTPAADAAAPVGHAACTSFQRVSPWLNVHFAHSDTAPMLAEASLWLSTPAASCLLQSVRRGSEAARNGFPSGSED
ncbi:MAG: hypothetical protein MJY45_03510, partial [Bacteroidales bacterium]|nr:hypothetical protein [Bacteroidales bacterium]